MGEKGTFSSFSKSERESTVPLPPCSPAPNVISWPYLTKNCINLVLQQKLKTSCYGNFYNSYHFHFGCCENTRK